MFMTDTCIPTNDELLSIIDKVEALDNSIRIAMINDNRHDDPLIQSWLNNLQDIHMYLHCLAGAAQE